MEYVIKINNKIYKQAGAYSVDYTQLWASGSGRNYGDFSWSGTVAGNLIMFKLQYCLKARFNYHNW